MRWPRLRRRRRHESLVPTIIIAALATIASMADIVWREVGTWIAAELAAFVAALALVGVLVEARRLRLLRTIVLALCALAMFLAAVDRIVFGAGWWSRTTRDVVQTLGGLLAIAVLATAPRRPHAAAGSAELLGETS